MNDLKVFLKIETWEYTFTKYFFLGETIGIRSDFRNIRNQHRRPCICCTYFYVNHFPQKLLFLLESFFFQNPILFLETFFTSEEKC